MSKNLVWFLVLAALASAGDLSNVSQLTSGRENRGDARPPTRYECNVFTAGWSL